MKRIFVLIILIIPFINLFGQSLDSLLLDAAYNDDEKAVFDLLRKGANPNAQTDDGVTPLMYAVDNGNLLIARKLLKSGANPDINSYYAPAALITATLFDDTVMVYTLLDNGASPDIVDSTNGMTPLLYAISRNNLAITDLLLSYGANPNLDLYNITPLNQALYSEADSNIFYSLIKAGANLNYENKKGLTPLMLAVKYNYPQGLKILLKNGAKCDYVSKKKNITAMEYALERHNKNAVNILSSFCKEDPEQMHKLALKYDYQYAAKEIRKTTGKKYLTPVFSSYIFSAGTKFSSEDFLVGLQAGIKESRYNIIFKTGLYARPIPTKILVPVRENYFLEYRESRIIFNAGFRKNFTLVNFKQSSTGMFAGLNYNISFGSYRGSLNKIQNRFLFSPEIGLWYRKNVSNFNLGVEYLPIYPQYPFLINFSYNILIPLR